MKSPPECLFVLNPRLFGIAIVIQSKCFFAWLDSGATENFIVKKIVDNLQCKMWKMKSPMYVKVATEAQQNLVKLILIVYL